MSEGMVIPRICGQARGEVPGEFARYGDRGFGGTRASTPRPVCGREIQLCLSTIGWGFLQVERRSGIDRHQIRRWIRGTPADPEFLAWLQALRGLHQRYVSPFAPTITGLGNRPSLCAHGVARACLVIGWSERTLAERAGEQRTAMRRRLYKGGLLCPRTSRWLDLLESGHRDYPRPEYHDVSTGSYHHA